VLNFRVEAVPNLLVTKLYSTCVQPLEDLLRRSASPQFVDADPFSSTM